MSDLMAEAAAALRWPATAPSKIEHLIARWRAFQADAVDSLVQEMSTLAACWSSLGEEATARILASPSVYLGIRTGNVALWGYPLLAEWTKENECGPLDAWTALGDIWIGLERPADVPTLTYDGEVWRGARLDCGIPIDQSLTDMPSHPAAGLREARRLTTVEEHEIVVMLDGAVALIDSVCPEAGMAVRAATSNIVLRADPQSPSPVRSASSSAALGRTVLVINGAVRPEAFAEALVHEAGHTLLSCGELGASLLADPIGPTFAGVSPWTGMVLPARAFLHACVIWSSLLAFWRLAVSRGIALEYARARVAWMTQGFAGSALKRELAQLAPAISASGKAALEEIEGGMFTYG